MAAVELVLTPTLVEAQHRQRGRLLLVVVEAGERLVMVSPAVRAS